jgi:hypothetical protein
LMLHCFLLDQPIASGENWGENDRKCYLAFSNSLVRSLREIGHEASARRTPTLAGVLKACCVIDAPRPLDFRSIRRKGACRFSDQIKRSVSRVAGPWPCTPAPSWGPRGSRSAPLPR